MIYTFLEQPVYQINYIRKRFNHLFALFYLVLTSCHKSTSQKECAVVKIDQSKITSNYHNQL